MSATFNPKIAVKAPNRNRFDLSYYTRLTSKMGELVPVLCKKIVPSDEFKVSISAITRLAPLANPVYDRVRIDYDAFFVQNRIIDKEFKEFLTGGIGLYGEDSTEGMQNITFQITYTNTNLRGGLLDFLGLSFGNRTSTSPVNIRFNAEPILGYYKIYSDWYRNERFQSDVFADLYSQITVNRTAPVSIETVNKLFKRNYFKDPYTTALAEPLIGGPIPVMSGTAPVVATQVFEGSTINANIDDYDRLSVTATSGGAQLMADLSAVASNTVQQLNQMYALYRFFMTDTYNGNRYVEFVESHFNVVVPDSTLERPLFLGRFTQNIAFSEIFQTSGSTGEGNTLGDYAGKGAGLGSGFLFHEKFLEHGYLYIIMSIVPESTYFQGIDSKFLFGDRFDSFYFPEFQNIGDAPISVWNLWSPIETDTSHNVNLSHEFAILTQNTFGYNRRNWDLIWYPNELHGDFTNPNSMLHWTFARKFDSKPVLGSAFSEINPVNNPFVYTDAKAENFFTDIYFDIKALRPVERYESITTH